MYQVFWALVIAGAITVALVDLWRAIKTPAEPESDEDWIDRQH